MDIHSNKYKLQPLMTLLLQHNYLEVISLIENGFFNNSIPKQSNNSINYKNELDFLLNKSNVMDKWLETHHTIKVNQAKQSEDFLNDFCLNHFAYADIWNQKDSNNQPMSKEDGVKKINSENKMFLYLYQKGFNPWPDNTTDFLLKMIDAKNRDNHMFFDESIQVICEDKGWSNVIQMLDEVEVNINDLLMKRKPHIAIVEKLKQHESPERKLNQGRPAVYNTLNPSVMATMLKTESSPFFEEKGQKTTLLSQLMDEDKTGDPENVIARAQVLSQYIDQYFDQYINQNKINDEETELIEKEKKQALVYNLCNRHPINHKDFSITAYNKLEKALKPKNINEAFEYNGMQTSLFNHILIQSALERNGDHSRFLKILYKKMNQKQFNDDCLITILDRDSKNQNDHDKENENGNNNKNNKEQNNTQISILPFYFINKGLLSINQNPLSRFSDSSSKEVLFFNNCLEQDNLKQLIDGYNIKDFIQESKIAFDYAKQKENISESLIAHVKEELLLFLKQHNKKQQPENYIDPMMTYYQAVQDYYMSQSRQNINRKNQKSNNQSDNKPFVSNYEFLLNDLNHIGSILMEEQNSTRLNNYVENIINNIYQSFDLLEQQNRSSFYMKEKTKQRLCNFFDKLNDHNIDIPVVDYLTQQLKEASEKNEPTTRQFMSQFINDYKSLFEHALLQFNINKKSNNDVKESQKPHKRKKML